MQHRPNLGRSPQSRVVLVNIATIEPFDELRRRIRDALLKADHMFVPLRADTGSMMYIQYVTRISTFPFVFTSLIPPT